jgi:predicted  nucleic acid-binding Zn-ribbon protein
MLRERHSFESELRQTVANTLTLVQDRVTASELRQSAALAETAANAESVIGIAIDRVAQRITFIEGNVLANLTATTERSIARVSAAAELKAAEISRSLEALSLKVDRLVMLSPDQIQALLAQSEEKAAVALERAAEVAAEMQNVIRPILALTPASHDSKVSSFSRAIGDWQTEMFEARAEIQKANKRAEHALEQVHEISGDTSSLVRSLQGEVAAAISALSEWTARVRPIEELQTELQFYGPLGVPKDSLGSSLREMLTELGRQRASTEQRLSGDILNLRGEMQRLVNALSE